ncbi:LPXTG-motif cell wall-anchored protein [Streptomyces sp. 846.5]|nr:LPXTG cell wall anchor domain-containing protein [Streptomyces sp. 846.5]TDU06359.1 LPXTG-motif cell wall-anchored protein [Streptomyces sp. 846.5]
MAMARRGHRKKYTGIRSRGVRVATAVLALTGTGLLVGGVASAATTPTLVQSKVIGGPLDGAVTLDPTVTDSTATDTATASDGATAVSTATAAATATGTAASSVVGGSATPTATASATPSASSSGSSAAGSGSSGGGTSAPQPRQMLAETGSDQSAPLLFAGGLTLLAGGLVFRFGPRTGTPRHAA